MDRRFLARFACLAAQVLKSLGTVSPSPQMESLSAELEALGGGDTRLAQAQVCCLCAPVPDGAKPTLSSRNGKVLVTDERVGGDQQPAIRRYSIPNFLKAGARGQDIFKCLGQVGGTGT